jgi:thiamine-monophosphate kinase
MNGKGRPAFAWRDASQPLTASEDALLAEIDALFPKASGHFPAGRGSDCAELAALPATLAVSTDMFWEDCHFRSAYCAPAEVGAKALAVAVSDLAAAGAVPLGFSLGLQAPPDVSRLALRQALAGMADKAREYGMALTGGDIIVGSKLGFSLCVWGKSCLLSGGYAARGRALPGDVLWLLGPVGSAKVGLWALERFGRAALDDWPESCAALLAPKPLLREGQALLQAAATAGYAERLSMMDVSDGLARDLPRLLAGCGATLDLPEEALSEEVRAAAPRMGLDPDAIALLGGEDYALLGSCPEPLWPLLRKAAPAVRRIGEATEAGGVLHRGKPLPGQGFDHFAAAAPDLDRAVAALTELGEQAHAAGLMAGFNGNLSCRRGDSAALITRSGAAKGRLRPEDFALIALPGGEERECGLPPSSRPPSSESPLHRDIYALCPESRVILHCHPPKLLALSLALPQKERLRLPLPEADRYRALLAWTPFFPPGSAVLAQAAAEAARTHPAIWLERHGLVVHGQDGPSVLALAEELEQLAEVQLLLSLETE